MNVCRAVKGETTVRQMCTQTENQSSRHTQRPNADPQGPTETLWTRSHSWYNMSNNNSLRDWQTASSVRPKRRVNHWVNFCVCTANVWFREGNPKKKNRLQSLFPTWLHHGTGTNLYLCGKRNKVCFPRETKRKEREKLRRGGGGKEFGSCKCRFLLQKSHICNQSCSLLKEKTLQGLRDLKEMLFPTDKDFPTFFLPNQSSYFFILV